MAWADWAALLSIHVHVLATNNTKDTSDDQVVNAAINSHVHTALTHCLL